MNETYAQIGSALRFYLDSNWVVADADVAWENAPYKPNIKPWIRVSVKPTLSYSNTIGCNHTYRKGFLLVQVFVRYDTGTGTVENILGLLSALFENQRIGTNIQFYTGEVTTIGDSTRQLNHIESDWFQVMVKFPFETL